MIPVHFAGQPCDMARISILPAAMTSASWRMRPMPFRPPIRER